MPGHIGLAEIEDVGVNHDQVIMVFQVCGQFVRRADNYLDHLSTIQKMLHQQSSGFPVAPTTRIVMVLISFIDANSEITGRPRVCSYQERGFNRSGLLTG